MSDTLLDFKDLCRKLSLTKKTNTEIQQKRLKIKNSFIQKFKLKSDNLKISSFSGSKINFLLELYDTYFFENKLISYFKENKCVLSVCFNNRCTSTGGICKTRDYKCISIEISSKVLDEAFKKIGIKTCGNIDCNDILECLQLLFEHELVHAILFCFCKNIEKIPPNQNHKLPGFWKGKTFKGHNKTFMSILNGVFGHTTHLHNILSIKKVNVDNKKISKHLKLNSKVTYLNRDKEEKGTVTKINRKTAEVKNINGKLYKVYIINFINIDGISMITESTSNQSSSTNINKTNLSAVKTNLSGKSSKNNVPKIVSSKPSKKKKLIIIDKRSKKPSDYVIILTKQREAVDKSKSSKKIMAGRTDKLKKYHKSKDLLEGECKFPFIYKGKKHYSCLDTGRGPWCATKLKPTGYLEKYGYCID